MEASFKWDVTTKVEFLKKLPSVARLGEALGFMPEKVLVIYDRRLTSLGKWLGEFPLTYSLKCGEGLKDMRAFSAHIHKIFKLVTPFSGRSLCVVAVGGGTLGDFAGFLSSVLKRGVPLVHVPTTLLAAMDSSHGGKTALNVGSFKNQIGTYYPANAVLIVKSLFENLPQLQLQSASGELAKMALVAGGELYRKFFDAFKMDLEHIWELLPDAIAAKYKIVEKDPFEATGERQILNFGHTLGHALESYYGIPHGVAVGEGIIFALNWSAHQGFLRGDEPRHLVQFLERSTSFLGAKNFVRQHRTMSRSRLSKLIMEDKKLTDARHLNFVFLEKVGTPFRKVVTIESLLAESRRQGWTSR